MATILIVDDHAVNREFLITLLGYHRHRLLEASDGARALALARAERPDLVISDILMPTMDGYEFVRRLRADPALVATPVIFYTAHYHGPEAQKLAADCGVAYMLTKPGEPELVLQTVAQALGQRKPPPSALSPDFDREHLQVLSDKLSAQVSELHRTTERFTALIDITLQLASERDPRRLLDSVCRAARELTAAKYAVLAVGNEDGTATSEFTTSGLEVETAARIGRPVLLEGPVRAALRQGKALRLTNPGGDSNAVGLPLQHLPVYALLVAPIVSLTRNYGWIALADKVGVKGFSAADELLVAALGAELGRFYENGSLYAEARRHAALLQESELRFRQLAENINEVFFLVSTDGTQILYISPAYEAVWDRSCESLYARPESWMESIHPNDQEAVRKGNEERDQTGELNYTYRIVRPDGSLRWISARGFPIRNDAGEIYRIAGIAEDITERVRLQNVLKEREAGLRRAQLTAKLAHVITRQGGLFESWSETLPSLIGVEPGRMPQSTREWLDFVHPDDRAIFRLAAIAADSERARKDVGYRLRRGDGAWIDVWQIIEPIQGGADDGMRWQSTLQDVTDRKQAETRIVRLNRVYAVLSGVNALIVRVRDRDELFKEACRIAVQVGQFPLAWVAVADSRDQLVKSVAWAGDERGYVQLTRPTVNAEAQGKAGLSAQAIERRVPVVCNDIEAGASAMRFAKEALERGYRSAAALPLVVDGTAIGALVLYAAETGFFDPEEMKLLEELAGDIAFALDHIAKEEKLDYLAFYDPLTGVPNRNLFRERLAQQVGAASREHRQLAVVLLDIERFNTINDTLVSTCNSQRIC